LVGIVILMVVVPLVEPGQDDLLIFQPSHVVSVGQA
jgi:hypothetical protein